MHGDQQYSVLQRHTPRATFADRVGPLTPPRSDQLAELTRALHSNDHDYAANRAKTDEVASERHEEFVSTVYQTEHPVRVHSETGERPLLLGRFVQPHPGPEQRRLRHLFELFQGHATRPENTVG